MLDPWTEAQTAVCDLHSRITGSPVVDPWHSDFWIASHNALVALDPTGDLGWPVVCLRTWSCLLLLLMSVTQLRYMQCGQQDARGCDYVLKGQLPWAWGKDGPTCTLQRLKMSLTCALWWQGVW